MPNLVLRLHEGDSVVTQALGLLTKGKGVVVITESKGLSRLGSMTRGDQLQILGHGDTTSLGDKSAQQLAKLLADNGLPSGIPIDLVACNCGTGGAPYAMELKNQLVAKKILPGTITAGTSVMWVKADGTPYAMDENTGTAIKKGTEVVTTPWGPRRKKIDPQYRVR